MKIIYFFAVVAATVLSQRKAEAQTAVAGTGAIAVQTEELRQRGDSLYLKLQFVIPEKLVLSRQSTQFTPVLTFGTQSRRLPAIAVMGRSDYRFYRRSLALMGRWQRDHYAVPTPYRVVEGGRQADKVVDYELTLPFEAWMSTAGLDLLTEDCGCGKLLRSHVTKLAENIELEHVEVIEPYQITPALAYIRPEAEVEKRRSEKGESRLDFAAGKTAIDPVFGRNPQELERIRDMVELVRNDKGVSIRGVVITGYASPEGSLALNQRLSENRASSLKNYLQSTYSDIGREMYTVRFGGENWEDLAKALEEADIPSKGEAMEIITGVEVLNNREAKLIALRGGAPWRQMLKELFPILRKATVMVNYDVKNFDLEEAREVVKTRPQNLSLNEMYAVAQTYDKGSREFNDLFETAVRMFPEDVTANINAAVAALERRDYAGADRYLKRVKIKMRIPEYENAMGVLSMMRDADYEKAEAYFHSAEQAGIEAAAANLDQIAKMRENADRIKAAEQN